MTDYELLTTTYEDMDKNIQHFDFKDTERLQANVNPHARMFSRKRTQLSAKEQRGFARAVKRARFMALMPYISR